MVLRQCQTDWRTQMSKNHKCFRKFIGSLNSEHSQEEYGYKIQKFMKWATVEKLVPHAEAFESLLMWDSEKITDVLEDYVFYLQESKYLNVNAALAPVELFFEMNRKIWHNKLVRKGIRRLDRIKGGDKPITDDELEKVYSGAKAPRERCIVSMLSSLGIRPGGLVDPILRFKHLIPIEDSYCIKIYDGSEEGYWGVLIPEARKDLDDYKASRIRNGETITDETPILGTYKSRWKNQRDYVTDDNLQEILGRLIDGKVERVKTGNTYDKAITYMFRKRFNTKLKLNNDVNSNVAEKVMAHKKGLDGTYLKPTMEECYAEVKKAIPELTIDPTERQKAQLAKKQETIDKLQQKTKETEDLETRIKKIEAQLREEKLKNLSSESTLS